MKIYYVRHGYPDYEIDGLTKEGQLEAKALYDNHFKDIQFDKIYTSTNGRAILTGELATQKDRNSFIKVDWLRESLAATYFMENDINEPYQWLFWHTKYKDLLKRKEILDLGDKWTEHPLCSELKAKNGIPVFNDVVDNFMLELGYKHDREKKTYIKIKNKTPKNVAIFAHGGIAMIFLSTLLDIPYPRFILDHPCHDTSAVSIIEINKKGVAKLLVYGAVSHKINLSNNTFNKMKA